MKWRMRGSTSLTSARPTTTNGPHSTRRGRSQALPAPDRRPTRMLTQRRAVAARRIAAKWIAAGLFGLALIWAQQLPFEPAHDSGQSITGAFEGWYPNADGSFAILAGY